VENQTLFRAKQARPRLTEEPCDFILEQPWSSVPDSYCKRWLERRTEHYIYELNACL
jgi:hypothetical protein